MAKFRIRWRHVLFNLPQVVMTLTYLYASWDSVRAAVVKCVKEDPQVADFLSAADELMRIFKK